MRLILAAGLAALALQASSAFAAPCASRGEPRAAAVRIDISRPEDRALAHALAPVLFEAVADRAPAALTCERETVRTDAGEYRLGGEDSDAFPRLALPVAGNGPAVFLAAAPATSGPGPRHLALVVKGQGGFNRITAVYRGIPDDRRLATDVRAALSARSQAIARYSPSSAMLAFGGATPLDAAAALAASLGEAGPQIYVAGDATTLRLVEITLQAVFHAPSGYPCPQRFGALPVLLMEVDPIPDRVACLWRSGTDMTPRGDPPRYRMIWARRPGATAQGLFDEAMVLASKGYEITGGRAPPAPAAAQRAGARNTAQGYTVAAWVAVHAEWTLQVTGAWPPGTAGDAEAAQVAGGLLGLAAELAAQRAASPGAP